MGIDPAGAPDICLVDIEMPHLSGLELAEKIKQANLPCKVMIVTTFARPGYLQKAMDCEVHGYLLKDEHRLFNCYYSKNHAGRKGGQ